jgi:DNA-binding CsgD family transcriptional regulator
MGKELAQAKSGRGQGARPTAALPSPAIGPARAGELAAISAVTALVDAYAAIHGLSRRERAVLVLGARGLHRKGTALYLGCSPGTIDTYWNRLLKKLRLSSQSEALAHLLQLALTDELARVRGRRADRRIEDQDKTVGHGRANQLDP